MANYAPNSAGLLEPLKKWLDDFKVSEILINKPSEVYIEKESVLNKYNVPELTPRFLNMLFQLIANENSQELNSKKPLLSGSLEDGSRVQLVLPPVAKFHTLSIRRKVIKNFSLKDYAKIGFYKTADKFDINKNSFDILPKKEQDLIMLYREANWPEFINLAIALKKNIVVSGGTSSGKTTFLNACLQNIPLDERIIILEDAREVDIPHENQVQLLASKSEQGIAKVSMQDLVQCCLRLRPDRIIMGELRGKEVMDFISACSTGHEGSITSIHANNPKIAFMRMAQMYKQNNVPSMSDADIMRELNEVVDIVVQLTKTPVGRIVENIYYKYGGLK